MGVNVKKVGDKEQTAMAMSGPLQGAGNLPLGALVVGCVIWNPADNDSAIWRDASSFYAFGTDTPSTATLEAWVLDGNGTEIFRTTSFFTPATGFPPDIPPSAAGADWACLCTGLTQGQAGTFFIRVVDGTGQTFSAHFSLVG
jgi:hypothetical protein